MKPLFLAAIAVSALSLCACGGGGYDADYDCEQTAACCEELGSTPSATTVSTCKQSSQQLYDNFNESFKAAADSLTEKCGNKTACDYMECAIGSLVCPW